MERCRPRRVSQARDPRRRRPRKSPLVIRGGGTKDFYGQAIAGDGARHDAPYAGIVDYDPTELVITARAGTPLADIERAMRASGQMLACEPPHFGARATLGGCVAAGLSGPRRPYAGAMRDIVLGVRMLDGRGEDLAFGGRVMKNVAGFDLARVMTGALGTLGVLTEISLKCVPLPKVEATRVLECSVGRRDPADQRVERQAAAGVGDLPSRGPARGAAVRRRAGGRGRGEADRRNASSPPAKPSGKAFASRPHAYFAAARAGGAPLWRLSVKATAPYQDLGGEQMIEWSGALRWLVAGERTRSREGARLGPDHGGHATLFRAADKSAGAFHPLPDTLHALHRRLKATFDPAGILNRGRLYPDF